MTQANAAQTDSDPLDDDIDPPGHTLVNRTWIRQRFGNGSHRAIRAPDFPKPQTYGGSNRRMPLWTVKAVKQWEQTHCLYGIGTTRCIDPRGDDPNHLGLCDRHARKAQRILERTHHD